MNDIVDILKEAGYGVVEGEKAVRAKIAELAEHKKSSISEMYERDDNNPLAYNP